MPPLRIDEGPKGQTRSLDSSERKDGSRLSAGWQSSWNRRPSRLRPQTAGRVPAAKIEATIVGAVRGHIGPDAPSGDAELVTTCVRRATSI
jgi:hypothetical protein